MVGKLAAGTKRRGRPRKKNQDRPLSAASSGRQQAPPLSTSRRSLRRRRPRCAEDYARYDEEDDDVDGYYYDELLLAEEEEEVGGVEIGEEDEVVEWKRRGKKFKLFQKLPNLKHHQSSNRGGSAASPCTSSASYGDGGAPKHLIKRKVGNHREGSGNGGHGLGCKTRRRSIGGDDQEGEDGQRHTTHECSGSASEKADNNCSISTPLLDKKILEKIFDKLQKKDTYGVFSEPVDPEELPDYHDIIEHPMDFSTIRKKLSTDVYANLEEIKSDIFLLCTNAMEYNAPDTIYFRQARSIQELARKKFETMRCNKEGAPKTEDNVQSNCVNKKPVKSFLCSSAPDPGEESNMISIVVPALTGIDRTRLKVLKNDLTEQPVIVEKVTNNILCDNRLEKGDETSAKSSVKLGRKSITLDEDRRTIYSASNEQPDNEFDSLSLFPALENEPKNLVAVGLDAECSYARSLAWFAGTLGPTAWRVASEILEKALPEGVKFGPGWVGEYEPLSTPVLFFEGHSKQFTCHAQLKHEGEIRENVALEGDRKSICSGTESVLFHAEVIRDSSRMIVLDDKSNHIKQSVKQGPYLYRPDTGFQPIISKGMVQQNSFDTNLTSNYSNAAIGASLLDKTMVQNSSLVMGNAVDISAQKHAAASGIFFISSSKNSLQSGNSVLTDRMSCVPEGSSSTSFTESRGVSNVEVAVGINKSCSLACLSKNEVKPGNGCFYHVEHLQAIDDPVKDKVMMMSRVSNQIGSPGLMASGNNNPIKRPEPSPRSNSSAAATAAARAWMSVGRSSEQKVADASKLFNMDDRTASFGNVASESIAFPSRNHRDDNTTSVPSISHLQIRAAAGEQPQKTCLRSFPQFFLTEMSKFNAQPPWQGLVPHVQRKDVCPPDLNISFQSPGSPVLQSGILVDSQQPDLALQL